MTDALDRFSPDELRRYARHFVLPDFGPEGQARLADAKVLCVGAGGLGSPLAMYLAAAGVGTLGLVDFDEVDLSNLQRQLLHGTDDVGRSKLDSATESLRSLNPEVRLVRHDARLTSDNALDLLRPYDVVVDGTDNFPTRYLVNDACVLLGIPNVYGSVFRWEGQLSLFAAPEGWREGEGRGPCYRCLFREPPDASLVQNCAEGGVLGVLPGIIGSLQALETVKWIVGVGDPMVGRLQIFDALSLAWREIEIRRNPECPVCGDEPTQEGLIDYELFCGVAPAEEGPAEDDVPEIGPAELAARLEGTAPATGTDGDRSDAERPFLLDVREPWEWRAGNLEAHGAVSIPITQVEDRLDDLPRDRDLVVYCRTGGRSADAVRTLRRAGFDRAVNLRGGIRAWAESIEPAVEVV